VAAAEIVRCAVTLQLDPDGFAGKGYNDSCEEGENVGQGRERLSLQIKQAQAIGKARHAVCPHTQELDSFGTVGPPREGVEW
jgi:hypothetical protein